MSAPTIVETINFAAAAHRGQRYGDEAYVNHVLRVAERLRVHGTHAVLAGLLHDWVEDCDGDLGYLYDRGYPDIVIEAVDAVSLRQYERYDALIMRAAAHPLGCLVKLADNLDNTAELYRLALSDQAAADRLSVKYAAVRPALVQAMIRHHGTPIGTPLRKITYGPPVPEGLRIRDADVV